MESFIVLPDSLVTIGPRPSIDTFFLSAPVFDYCITPSRSRLEPKVIE